MTASETALFDRVRQSGTCPPSLLKEGGFGEGDDGFAAAVLSVLDGTTGTFHRPASPLPSLEPGTPPLFEETRIWLISQYPNAVWLSYLSTLFPFFLPTGIALRSDASAGTEFDKAVKVRNV